MASPGTPQSATTSHAAPTFIEEPIRVGGNPIARRTPEVRSHGWRHSASLGPRVETLPVGRKTKGGGSADPAPPREPRHYGISLDQCYFAEVSAIADVSAIIEEESVIPVM